MKPTAKILEYLEIVAPFLPTPLYWLDINSKALGVNKAMMQGIGAPTSEFCIGKSAYDIYPLELAKKIIKHNEEVMLTGKTMSQEEVIQDITTGETRIYTAVKSPLYDDEGNIIGTVGTSIDITAQKEAERLAIESKTKQISAELDAYKKFKNIADQMAHDLGSPLMALSVLENHCAELPEAKRNMLRESISSIREIAGSLLSQYKPHEDQVDMDYSDEILIYAVVEQVILEKQHEYHNLSIKFISEYEEDARFSFIKGSITAFKRMLSNLINNSVQAIGSEFSSISIKLENDDQYIKIIITDNGIGIPQNIINKLMNNIQVTSGKDGGHGIGFSQIHEALEQNKGVLYIESKIAEGTVVTLTFPRIATPEWLVDTITINPDDTIIILDDDNSIHGAWDVRFIELLKTTPNLKVIHYTQATDAIDYINGLTETEKENILLLTDYELLKQNLNGLDVISKTQVLRSILVTSHYNNPEIRQSANFSNTRILPKILASFTSIEITTHLNNL